MAERHWLNAERLTVYPRILVVMFGLAGLGYGFTFTNGVDGRGRPMGADFITFWAAGSLALQGRAPDAYEVKLIWAAEQAAVPAVQNVFAWFYPPTFHLLVVPLALLPYGLALFCFVASSLTAFLAVLGRAVRRREAWWLIAAFPGLWLCVAQGQTGFLTAALAGGALLLLQQRRPVMAGVLIGLLAIKPQLALLFGIGLLAVGGWTTLLTAALVAGAFLGAAVLTLGMPTLGAWLGSLDLARLALETGGLPWAKSPSVFAAARLLGVPATWSYLLQAVVALVVAVVLVVVWRSTAAPELKGAALMVGTFLVTPYAFDYDLVWLAFSIAWLALTGLREGWMPAEREILLAAYLLPLALAPVALLTHVSLGPVVLGLLLWCFVRRATFIAEKVADPML